ncbi:MFS general substrate transporter [Corynespora cassiicola Philippines]|uniref:MFS general substrate transporter n=1 Tax=Corynespora cassiicola Philippines TaxID=1448308 RepID=A0A2T2P2S0_CORCC|nr:MFS general substrate transporter [Corynespora cassiicola Philippines]
MTAASTLDIIFAVVLTTALLLFVMIASEGIARGDKDILETSDGPRGKAAKRPDGEGLEELQTRGETRDGQATPKIGETSQRDVEVGLEPIDVDRIEKVYKKLDRRILPAFWVLYFLCSAIRSNIGLAQTMNSNRGHDLASELNLTPKQVSTGLALFYVCYVLFDLPSNLVMSRLSPHIWMSRIVTGVGIIGACMTAMKAAWSFFLLRLLLGIVIAGMWPGMSYYLTLFYPPSRTGKRIGRYFTAAQVSAAVVGLVSAGFQEMDGLGGLVGFQWMFLLYGLVGTLVGISLLWWLPDRPLPPGQVRERTGWQRFIPESKPALTGEDARIHYEDLRRVYHRQIWTWKELWAVVIDWRLWPLVVMYFGVVGVGIGTQSYGTVIIRGINPNLTGIQLSLLFAPIWVMDLIAILIVTPLSDRFNHHRALFFSGAVMIQITGLLVTTFAGNGSSSWARYGGLLLVGFGLGPTVPICMAWSNELFQPRHGEVGVAAASALVSGLGNLGSILTTYALYTGWPADSVGPHRYRKSNLVMIGILCGSILSAGVMQLLLRIFGNPRVKQISSASSTSEGEAAFIDGAARREVQQRGLGRMFCFR